ncbi:hypothetical protein Ae201684P_005211 [Aphanomyces euteiches]|uniref:HSF-type DNA-binding domain-containing protein n=1 Tax=Aphanomyces euteiches TaxID=100861 RepID=A0A6G0X0M3_9STRA|nr:hypothetical protein Ae201684_009668 [Aphanomyces euteiches]KAH9085505.1 hypothetical protein Ae201684P_005211 [Aphanomyces euteiches]KAH9135808.1 hypothetical protein AeRB84_018858 [Aphanomyces euteiches]
MVISDSNDARKRLLEAMAQKNSLHANTHADIHTIDRHSVHDIGERPSMAATAAPVGIPSNFLRNLYGFLNNNLLPDTIAWDADGRSFSILDPAKMETSLPMPNLYRGRFKTFKMQLEKHGFMKSPDGTRYYRPDFVKGQPQQLGDAAIAAASFDDLVEPDARPPLSLECRIQLPKRRRLSEQPMVESDPSTQPFWNSVHDSPSPTNGLTCSINISKHRFGHHPSRHDPTTSIPSLRHHSHGHSAHLHPAAGRLPSIGRAFPLFGLNKPSDT